MNDVSAIEFERYRPFLTGLAYRMLGSLADAQDIVQDAFLRWHRSQPDDIVNRRGWLATVVTRLCIDWLGSARVKREAYVGPWLPDPIVETLAAPATDRPEDRIDAPVALMLALERLSPLERAAFILHDVMDIDIAEVAAMIGRSQAACRQLLVRARAHVGEPNARFPVDPEAGERIASAFFEAIRTGDVTPLAAMLAEDAVLHTDGGGKVQASLNVIRGADRIYRFYAGIIAKRPAGPRAWSGPLAVNGLPGFAFIDAAGILQTMAFAIEAGRIAAIYVVRNPDKLSGLAAIPQIPADPSA